MAEFRYAVEIVNTDPEWFQRFVYGGPAPYDVVPGLSATQVRVVSARLVDPRLERWNGLNQPTNCTRPATAAERDAFDGIVRRLITLEAFYLLFKKSERIAMREAMRGTSIGSPILAPDDELADMLMILEYRAQNTGGVQLASARVGNLLDKLVTDGILTPERQAAILAGEEPS